MDCLKFSLTGGERWDDHFLAIFERDFALGGRLDKETSEVISNVKIL